MKPNYPILTAGFACLALAVSAFAQTTAPGNNTLAPLSSENQTASPAGQTDFQTDPFTGRFGYSVPFDLAPVRHGSAPNLELTYNSSNPNSWCGVGWDLENASSGTATAAPPSPTTAPNTGQQFQRLIVDSKGNIIPLKPGEMLTRSPNGKWVQVRDANGKPTGTRLDGGHKSSTHTDPRAQDAHAHVPGATNPDGTPWLPINQ
jgi:hypothetical protein